MPRTGGADRGNEFSRPWEQGLRRNSTGGIGIRSTAPQSDNYDHRGSPQHREFAHAHHGNSQRTPPASSHRRSARPSVLGSGRRQQRQQRRRPSISTSTLTTNNTTSGLSNASSTGTGVRASGSRSGGDSQRRSRAGAASHTKELEDSHSKHRRFGNGPESGTVSSGEEDSDSRQHRRRRRRHGRPTRRYRHHVRVPGPTRMAETNEPDDDDDGNQRSDNDHTLGSAKPRQLTTDELVSRAVAAILVTTDGTGGDEECGQGLGSDDEEEQELDLLFGGAHKQGRHHTNVRPQQYDDVDLDVAAAAAAARVAALRTRGARNATGNLPSEATTRKHLQLQMARLATHVVRLQEADSGCRLSLDEHGRMLMQIRNEIGRMATSLASEIATARQFFFDELTAVRSEVTELKSTVEEVQAQSASKFIRRQVKAISDQHEAQVQEIQRLLSRDRRQRKAEDEERITRPGGRITSAQLRDAAAAAHGDCGERMQRLEQDLNGVRMETVEMRSDLAFIKAQLTRTVGSPAGLFASDRDQVAAGVTKQSMQTEQEVADITRRIARLEKAFSKLHTQLKEVVQVQTQIAEDAEQSESKAVEREAKHRKDARTTSARITVAERALSKLQEEAAQLLAQQNTLQANSAEAMEAARNARAAAASTAASAAATAASATAPPSAKKKGIDASRKSKRQALVGEEQEHFLDLEDVHSRLHALTERLTAISESSSRACQGLGAAVKDADQSLLQLFEWASAMATSVEQIAAASRLTNQVHIPHLRAPRNEHQFQFHQRSDALPSHNATASSSSSSSASLTSGAILRDWRSPPFDRRPGVAAAVAAASVAAHHPNAATSSTAASSFGRQPAEEVLESDDSLERDRRTSPNRRRQVQQPVRQAGSGRQWAW